MRCNACRSVPLKSPGSCPFERVTAVYEPGARHVPRALEGDGRIRYMQWSAAAFMRCS